MNIIINQLQKNFGPKVAVDIENYSIQSGNMLGLVGNNGAGKTTLFRLMLDLLKAGVGAGIFSDISVVKEFHKTEAISEPDLRTKGMYEELRCMLEEAYHALKNVNGKLSSLSAIQGKE